jgi:hypothetical protein
MELERFMVERGLSMLEMLKLLSQIDQDRKGRKK